MLQFQKHHKYALQKEDLLWKQKNLELKNVCDRKTVKKYAVTWLRDRFAANSVTLPGDPGAKALSGLGKTTLR